MDNWSIRDFWLSHTLAIAIDNGHDPETAGIAIANGAPIIRLEETQEPEADADQ